MTNLSDPEASTQKHNRDIYVDDVRDKEYDILFLSHTNSYEGKDAHGLFQVFKYFYDTLGLDCAFVCAFEKHIEHTDTYVIYDLSKQNSVLPDFVEYIPKHSRLVIGDKNDFGEDVLSSILERHGSELLVIAMVHNAHTGSCGYPGDYQCEKYKHIEGCYNCPDYKQKLIKQHGEASIYSKKVLDPDYPMQRFVTHRGFLEKYGHRVTLCAASTASLTQASQSFLYKNIRKVLTPLKHITPRYSNIEDLLSARAKYKSETLRALQQEAGFEGFEKICYWSAWDPSTPRKGLEYYIEALHLLASSDKYMDPKELEKVAFVFSGRPDKFVFHHSFVPENVRTVVYPLLPSDAVIDLLHVSDLYVCTTLEDAGPRTIPEALSCGTPVVSFDQCIATDLVNETNGALVATRDSYALASGIATLLNNLPDMQENYASEAYESFAKFYDPERTEAAWCSALKLETVRE